MSLNIAAAAALLGGPFKDVLENIAEEDLDAIAKDELTSLAPTHGSLVTLDTLTQNTLGATKHYLRGKVGFLVDVAWADPDFIAALTPLCQQAAQAALSAAGAGL